MLPNEVLLRRLIRSLRRSPQSVVQELHDVGEGVPEDPAEGAERVYTGPAKLLQRKELIADHTARGLFHGAGPNEAEDHAHALAASLDRLQAPEVHRNGLGVRAHILKVLRNGRLSCSKTPGHGRLARDAVGVERMNVTAGGQDAGAITQKVPTRSGQDVFAIESAQESTELLPILPEEATDLDRFVHQGGLFFGATSQCLLGRGALAEALQGGLG
mmetsp:Transcript_57768/g.126753  ORF Transcript_57768/g.126753 Transcript_57768/m.126753 type:complete len:216 (+) Transcript_57768:998-1645(+)